MSYSYGVLRQSCPECRAGAGERCLDRRSQGRGRYVVKVTPHSTRVTKAREVAKLGRGR